MKLGGFPERIWRLALLLAIWLALGTIAPPGPDRPLPGGGEGALAFAPIPFDPENPARRDAGRLHFLGGWEVTSPDPRFGAVSGLRIVGGEAIALSDAGMIMRFPLPEGVAVPRVRFQPLLQGPGPRRSRSSRDSEGLLVEGGRLWVAFEGANGIWRYDLATLATQAAARPPAMRAWPGNSGPEALVRLADGRFLVFGEWWDDGAPTSPAVLFAGDPAVPGTAAIRLRYRRPDGYRATDAALLPDGRILILNRRFAWLRFSAKLVVAEVGAPREGGEIAGTEVATLEAPLPIDNMEGLAVTQERGRTIVWLASDDDFMRRFRRTLLLKFELRL